jgi:hypothetical protein
MRSQVDCDNLAASEALGWTSLSEAHNLCGLGAQSELLKPLKVRPVSYNPVLLDYSLSRQWKRRATTKRGFCPGVWIETAESIGVGSGDAFSLG